MNPNILGAAGLIAGGLIVWIVMRLKADANAKAAGHVIGAARQEAETLLREARAAAQNEMLKAREEFDRATRERRQELAEMEKRVMQRETTLDRKADLFDRKTEELTRKEQEIVEREKELHRLHDELEEVKRLSRQELQRVAGLSGEEARRQLLARVQDDIRADAAALTREILDQARQDADREAKRIITIAIERCAADHVHSATTHTLTLPSEEMKGRIIGREGRNIRAFEAATGINVLIDDTPQAVVLSGFDPVRREVARLTLEQLVADGRINPARIEEEVAKARIAVEAMIKQAGEDAVFELGLQKVHPDLIELLGRLKFRHSFSQNVLDHSIEVAELEGRMAAELGLNQRVATRIGLFHDIGKAVDNQMQGSHAAIGAEILRKHGESEEVWRAVACHHHEVEPITVYGALAGAADALSASRPGARSESMDLYLQRLEKLEAIANSFPGVDKSYALQAGREIRILVQPDRVSDDEAVALARQVTKKIEAELQYPGQIKVTVVREMRTVEYAK
jgi:ribonuclease Y